MLKSFCNISSNLHPQEKLGGGGKEETYQDISTYTYSTVPVLNMFTFTYPPIINPMYQKSLCQFITHNLTSS
jgi:hypothetical protein